MKAHKKNFFINEMFYEDEIYKTEGQLIQVLGDEVDLDIKLEEIEPSKKEFKVAASIYGLGEPFFVSQRGETIKKALSNLKKIVKQKVRTFTDRKIKLKRRNRKSLDYQNLMN